MEEDVLGPMRTLPVFDYVGCSRCSKMTPSRDLHVVQSPALDGLSEYEQLCPTCYADFIAGDDFPAEP